MNKYFVTFGSNPDFPYPNQYLIIIANSEKEANELFRLFFPDKNEGLLNYSFLYDEKEWQQIKHPESCAGGIEHLSNGYVVIQTNDKYLTVPYHELQKETEEMEY